MKRTLSLVLVFAMMLSMGLTASATNFDFALDEKIVDITITNFDKQEILFFTESGFVKKTAYKEYEVQKAYFQAVKIKIAPKRSLRIRFYVCCNKKMYVTYIAEMPLFIGVSEE